MASDYKSWKDSKAFKQTSVSWRSGDTLPIFYKSTEGNNLVEFLSTEDSRISSIIKRTQEKYKNMQLNLIRSKKQDFYSLKL